MWLHFSSNQALCLRVNTVLLFCFVFPNRYYTVTFDPSSTFRPSLRNKCLSFGLSFEVSLQALQSLIPVTRPLSLNNSDRCRRLITPGHSAAPFKDTGRSQRLSYLFCKCEPLQDPNNDFSKNTSAMTIHQGVIAQIVAGGRWRTSCSQALVINTWFFSSCRKRQGKGEESQTLLWTHEINPTGWKEIKNK